MRNNFSLLTHKGRWLLATLTLLFTLGIGQMWAADPNMPTECMEFPTNSTYMSSLQFNGSSYTNKYYLSSSADTVILNQYLMNQSSETNSKKIKWITYNDKGSSSSNWDAALGFKGWKFWNVNSQASIKSSRVSWYRIKGASKFIGFYNGASSSNKCIVSAYEITYSGETPVKSSTAAVTRTKQSSSADTIQLALNSSKEYIIELTSSSTSGYKMTEVMFIAPTISYTIQYNSNGGSGTMSNSTNTVSACTFTAPSATKVFDHWNDKADDSGANYAVGASVGKDITLYAQWADKFTVTYDKNGGTGTMANTTNEIVACTFTAPSGKGFKEWNSQADGKGTKYEVGATVTSNLDLYAIWKSVPQTIFDWTAATTNNIEADDTDLSNATYGTLTTGTSVKGRLLGTIIL